MMEKAQTIAGLLRILAEFSPDILVALASSVAGGLIGGLITVGLRGAMGLTLTAAPTIAVGTNAYALGAGTTAVAMKGGIAIAIDAEAPVAAFGGIAMAISPVVVLGIGVGALIGLKVFLAYK